MQYPPMQLVTVPTTPAHATTWQTRQSAPLMHGMQVNAVAESEEEDEEDETWYDPYDPVGSHAQRCCAPLEEPCCKSIGCFCDLLERCGCCCCCLPLLFISVYLLAIIMTVILFWNSVGQYSLFVSGFKEADWELRNCTVKDAGFQDVNHCGTCDASCRPCPSEEKGCSEPASQDAGTLPRRLYYRCTPMYMPWAEVELETKKAIGRVRTCATRYGVDTFGCSGQLGHRYGSWLDREGFPMSWHNLRLSFVYSPDSVSKELKAFGVIGDEGTLHANSKVKCWLLSGEDVAVRFSPPDESPEGWFNWVWILLFCVGLFFFVPILLWPFWMLGQVLSERLRT